MASSPSSGTQVSQVVTSSASNQVKVPTQSGQQQVIVIPSSGSGLTPTIPGQTLIIKQPGTQSGIQVIGQSQILNQSGRGLTVLSSAQGSGQQLYYIVSPTRPTGQQNLNQTITTGNKVIISSPTASQTQVVRNNVVTSTPQGASLMQTIAQTNPGNAAIVNQGQNNIVLPVGTQQTVYTLNQHLLQPSQTAVSKGLTAVQQTASIVPSTQKKLPSIQTSVAKSIQFVSQSKPMFVSQASYVSVSNSQIATSMKTNVAGITTLAPSQVFPAKSPQMKLVPKSVIGNVSTSSQSKQTTPGSPQPVTLQLKISDPALLQKLGITQGKGVVNLSGINLSQALASQKIQIIPKSGVTTVAQPKLTSTIGASSGLQFQLTQQSSQQVKPVPVVTSCTQSIPKTVTLTKHAIVPQTVLTPKSDVSIGGSNLVARNMQTLQSGNISSNQGTKQQFVILSQSLPSSTTVSVTTNTKALPTYTVVNTAHGGQKLVLSSSVIQGSKKVITASSSQLQTSSSGVVFHTSSGTSVLPKPQQVVVSSGTQKVPVKRITMSPGSVGCASTTFETTNINQRVITIPVPSKAQESSKLPIAPIQMTSAAGSSSNLFLTKPILHQGTESSCKQSVIFQKPSSTIIKAEASTDKERMQPSSSVSQIPPKSALNSTAVTKVSIGQTSALSQVNQSYAGKFIRILPPKPGQKQNQMVITVNPDADVNSEVKSISQELAKLQQQPRTQETLQKLQDLQTRLQQLQVVTQLLNKAKSGTSALHAALTSSNDEAKERRKMIKQRKFQEKANRIVEEAVQRAKAAGNMDIPNVAALKLPSIPSSDDEDDAEEEEEEKRKKKKDKSRSKSKKSKDNKKDKEQKDRKSKSKRPPSVKKKPVIKSWPAAAMNKLKRQKRKRGEDCSDESDFDETPPRSPVLMMIDDDGKVVKRRSGRNTNRKKYTEEYDFNITDEESSSSDENGAGEKKKKKIKHEKSHAGKVVKISSKEKHVESNAEIDVESVDSTMQAKFFVDNPDEDDAYIVERILCMRIRKKPPLPGEAQVGEVEEFYVKYRNFSYLHCEWVTATQLVDPRIHQKIKRFKLKCSMSTPNMLQQMEEEPFNPDYVIVDRILEEALTKETNGELVTHYLVKWCSLPYEDATWELSTDVDDSKIQFFKKFLALPDEKEREHVYKAEPISWKKLAASPLYKNGNNLRDYQLEGINWLSFSWCNGQNCILADEMGLGKTIQTICFLLEVEKFGIRGPFLVIAPLSTIANWQREFESWSDMNVIVYHGSSQSRHMIAEYEMFYKDARGIHVPNFYKFQVLITTYEIVLADCQELSQIEWRIAAIDEAHRLKNRNCKLMEGLKILDVEHRVLLTGTPLQNNVEELFSLLNFLEPGRFRSLYQFLEDFGDLKTEGQVERLQELLRPMMLRRLKEDVEKSLAPKEETIIEVELTSIQKRYYRAILERNFSFLAKGTSSTVNLPNLMNTMMELRKCCNHPFLINGAEDQILLELDQSGEPTYNIHIKALIQSAGKMVLLDKLLPKLKEGGHKVLVFSQMIRCLDILEDYLLQKRYLYERIDGRVRGNLRQAAIDRFCKPESDRFIFLLCTRAGGLGINLTAADTCIIFDSDWNPQNDLQAQARCHRIGQEKAVKVYRLITRNSYEREMFDKASKKLGLDRAVLQSMRGEKDAVNSQQHLSKTEIEDLLRKGAYGAIMDDDDASSTFCEEDIEVILQRRTKVIQVESGVKGSTFAKASFEVASDHADIKIDDPDFWQKWAKKADINLIDAEEEKILLVPRQRKQTRRYGGNDIAELESSDEEEKKVKEEKPSKKQLHVGWTRLECFRVEKGLLTFGWGCWEEIIATTRFRRRLGEKDIEAISRTMLIYCLQHYKGDENIKSFIWDLVTPTLDGQMKDIKQHKGLSVLVPRGGRKSKKPKKAEEVAQPCILEFDFSNKDKDAETLLTDEGYKNHLKRHCNKVLLRVRLLYYLRHEIVGNLAQDIDNGFFAGQIPFKIPAPEGEKPIYWWDEEADRSLLIGVYKHGYERYFGMRLDPCLCFLDRCGLPARQEMVAQAKEDDEFNDSQLDVDGLVDQEPTVVPKHVKEEDTGSQECTGSLSPSASPGSISKKRTNIPSEPGKLPFPQAPDLNTRVRRLVAGFQREQKKKQLKEAKKQKKEQVKKLRMQEQTRQREQRKIEGAQKWSRREESDFYRILSAFGIEQNSVTGEYNWMTFKKLAKLDRKYDEKMTEFYEHYRVMCLKVCHREDEIPEDYANKPALDYQIEYISEERASKCLQRIDLLSKIRNEVLPHPELNERLKKCLKSVEMPEWWEPGRHDKDLLIGVSRYGVNRMESQQMMMKDKDLCFKELVDRYPQMGVPPPGSFSNKPKNSKKKKKIPKKLEGKGDGVSHLEPGGEASQGSAVNEDPLHSYSQENSTQHSFNMDTNEETLHEKDERTFNSSLSEKNTPSEQNSHVDRSTLSKDDIPVGENGNMDGDAKDLQDGSGDREEVTSEKKDFIENGEKQDQEKNENGSIEDPQPQAKQMSEAEILYTYILRWPKDRIICHRLELVCHTVVTGQWPGRKHHHPPPQSIPPDPSILGMERGATPLEHNYAGDFYGNPTREERIKKKKKKKRSEFDDGRTEGSYEVFKLLSSAGSADDSGLLQFFKKKKRPKDKEGDEESDENEYEIIDEKPRKKRKKEKLKESLGKEIDPLTGLPVAFEGSQSPPPKKRKRLKDPATLSLDSITGEEKVGIIERDTGYVLPAKRVPLLKDVAVWISKHSRYDVTFEWGEIVIKKGFLPPELYNRISKTPSAQKSSHTSLYHTRATTSSPSSSAPVCSGILPTEVPLAASLSSKVSVSQIGVPTVMTTIPAAMQEHSPPRILPGVPPALLSNAGGVLYSPILSAKGVVQTSQRVTLSQGNKLSIKDEIKMEKRARKAVVKQEVREDMSDKDKEWQVESDQKMFKQVKNVEDDDDTSDDEVEWQMEVDKNIEVKEEVEDEDDDDEDDDEEDDDDDEVDDKEEEDFEDAGDNSDEEYERMVINKRDGDDDFGEQEGNENSNDIVGPFGDDSDEDSVDNGGVDEEEVDNEEIDIAIDIAEDSNDDEEDSSDDEKDSSDDEDDNLEEAEDLVEEEDDLVEEDNVDDDIDKDDDEDDDVDDDVDDVVDEDVDEDDESND